MEDIQEKEAMTRQSGGGGGERGWRERLGEEGGRGWRE